MKKIILLLLAFNFIFAYVGKITALKGDANIIRNSKIIPAKLGMKIDTKDIIKTKNSQMQIIFKDRTIITIGKNSKFSITDYIFDNKNQKMDFKLSKGLIKTITGKISKIAPQKFHIKTKNAIIGIRGTIFIVEFNNNSTILKMFNGITTFTDLKTNKMIEVTKGQKIILNPNLIKRIKIGKFNLNQNTFNIKNHFKTIDIKNINKLQDNLDKISNLTNTINNISKVNDIQDIIKLKEDAINTIINDSTNILNEEQTITDDTLSTSSTTSSSTSTTTTP